MAAPRSVLSSAKLIALCTLASRITGLARDVLLAQAFGLRWVQDAFSFAFALPNLFRRLFGEGGLAPVFVPVFTRTLETDGPDAAWRLFRRSLALLTTVLVAIALLVELTIAVLWFAAPGPTPEEAEARRLLLGLSALTLPFMVSICVLSLLAALLNCLGSFVPAALAPVLLNVCMIVGIMWIGPTLGGPDPARQVYGVAAMVLVAGLLQLAVLFPALRAKGVVVGWELTTRDPAVREMLRMMVPVALGQSVLAIGTFLDSVICTFLTKKTEAGPDTFDFFGLTAAYPLHEGALSAITIAQRLYQFPLGVLVISLATAALPAFARHATRKDWGAWGTEVRQLLRLSVFEGVLAGAMMLAMAPQLVRLLFEYRNFHQAATLRTAHVLLWYGAGMWAFCAQHIVSRAFYSLGDVRTPLRIAVAVLPVNVILSVSLLWLEGVRESAFAISSVTTYSIATVAGIIILQRRTAERLLDRSLIAGVGLMVLFGAIAGIAVAWIAPQWEQWAAAVGGPRIVTRSIDTLGLLALGATLYLGLSLICGLPEARKLLAIRRTRKTPPSG